jgi:hypothetical protein
VRLGAAVEQREKPTLGRGGEGLLPEGTELNLCRADAEQDGIGIEREVRRIPADENCLAVCEYVHWQGRNAAEDAEDLIAGGDYRPAATRLLEASELLRLAAHQLDREI